MSNLREGPACITYYSTKAAQCNEYIVLSQNPAEQGIQQYEVMSMFLLLTFKIKGHPPFYYVWLKYTQLQIAGRWLVVG